MAAAKGVLIPFTQAAVPDVDVAAVSSASTWSRPAWWKTRMAAPCWTIATPNEPSARAEGRRGQPVTFRASVLTLYPEMFPGALGVSLAGRALAGGAWSLETIQIRDFATRQAPHRRRHAGRRRRRHGDARRRAGPAIDHASPPGDMRPRLLMSPRGKPLTQARVRELAAGPGAVIVCGRFEGVDQRVIDARGLEEVSVGDFILSGGEPAALVLLDAVVRLLPGVMGNAVSGDEESFENGLLEHPHYTRPQEFEGRPSPKC